jgi:hypothetical protein
VCVYTLNTSHLFRKLLNTNLWVLLQNDIIHEAQTMKAYHHPNVLSLYTSFVHGQDLWMITPFMSGGSILHVMKYRFPKVGSKKTGCSSRQQETRGSSCKQGRPAAQHKAAAAGTGWCSSFIKQQRTSAKQLRTPANGTQAVHMCRGPDTTCCSACRTLCKGSRLGWPESYTMSCLRPPLHPCSVPLV